MADADQPLELQSRTVLYCGGKFYPISPAELPLHFRLREEIANVLVLLQSVRYHQRYISPHLSFPHLRDCCYFESGGSQHWTYWTHETKLTRRGSSIANSAAQWRNVRTGYRTRTRIYMRDYGQKVHQFPPYSRPSKHVQNLTCNLPNRCPRSSNIIPLGRCAKASRERRPQEGIEGRSGGGETSRYDQELEGYHQARGEE